VNVIVDDLVEKANKARKYSEKKLQNESMSDMFSLILKWWDQMNKHKKFEVP